MPKENDADEMDAAVAAGQEGYDVARGEPPPGVKHSEPSGGFTELRNHCKNTMQVALQLLRDDSLRSVIVILRVVAETLTRIFDNMIVSIKTQRGSLDWLQMMARGGLLVPVMMETFSKMANMEV